jgi:hypothetical protein
VVHQLKQKLTLVQKLDMLYTVSFTEIHYPAIVITHRDHFAKLFAEASLHKPVYLRIDRMANIDSEQLASSEFHVA